MGVKISFGVSSFGMELIFHLELIPSEWELFFRKWELIPSELGP